MVTFSSTKLVQRTDKKFVLYFAKASFRVSFHRSGFGRRWTHCRSSNLVNSFNRYSIKQSYPVRWSQTLHISPYFPAEMKPYRKAKNMANSDGATRFAAILSCESCQTSQDQPGNHIPKFHSIVTPWKWDVVWRASDSDPECRLFVPFFFTR